MRDFRTLTAWQRSHAFVLDIYKLTASFPREELYGLTSQIKRSAASVPTKIAEVKRIVNGLIRRVRADYDKRPGFRSNQGERRSEPSHQPGAPSQTARS